MKLKWKTACCVGRSRVVHVQWLALRLETSTKGDCWQDTKSTVCRSGCPPGNVFCKQHTNLTSNSIHRHMPALRTHHYTSCHSLKRSLNELDIISTQIEATQDASLMPDNSAWLFWHSYWGGLWSMSVYSLQGNGVARDKLTFKDSDLFIFDMYNNRIWPQDTVAKRGIDHDGSFRSGCKDEEYLEKTAIWPCRITQAVLTRYYSLQCWNRCAWRRSSWKLQSKNDAILCD